MIRGFLLFLLVAIAPAYADEMRPGYLEFSQNNATDWRLVWKAPLRGGVTPDTRPVLPDSCALTGATERQRAAAAVILSSAVRCKRNVAGQSIGLSGLAQAKPMCWCAYRRWIDRCRCCV
ncbi:MAG: hypothetical protein IPH79_14475 [Sphingomonadales bacterium]|nr:hypothetical protein [Sphingomonadales bacterium]